MIQSSDREKNLYVAAHNHRRCYSDGCKSCTDRRAPKPGNGFGAERRLERGADIVVLPELFNTGYSYAPQMHSRAENLDGQTVAWMRDIAARTEIHLAGSLLLFDGMDIANTMLLVAPDGDLWRYDKCYPWCWERSCLRPGNTITIADTRLGKFGMLVCWDTAHLHLWAAYAGKIDLLLISSCPPDGANPRLSLHHVPPLTLGQLGPVGKPLQHTGSTLFGAMINEQTAWLGVPAICTVATGRITTPIPRGQATLVSFLPAAPWLFPYFAEAHTMSMSCDMIPGCKVLDSRGTPRES